MRIPIAFAALAFLLTTAPLRAQETPAPPDTTPPAAEALVPPDTAQAAEEEVATHDWEFALAPTDRAAGASGNVLVTEGDSLNTFVVVVAGLPPVDSLDEEGRDVAGYTVWVVPSKERVQESTLAGTLTVDAQGAGRFEGSTAFDTFGVIVLASAAETSELSGVPALTGIPVAAAPAGEQPAAPPPPAPPAQPEEAPETPEPEAPEPDEPDLR